MSLYPDPKTPYRPVTPDNDRRTRWVSVVDVGLNHPTLTRRAVYRPLTDDLTDGLTDAQLWSHMAHNATVRAGRLQRLEALARHEAALLRYRDAAPGSVARAPLGTNAALRLWRAVGDIPFHCKYPKIISRAALRDISPDGYRLTQEHRVPMLYVDALGDRPLRGRTACVHWDTALRVAKEAGVGSAGFFNSEPLRAQWYVGAERVTSVSAVGRPVRRLLEAAPQWLARHRAVAKATLLGINVLYQGDLLSPQVRLQIPRDEDSLLRHLPDEELNRLAAELHRAVLTTWRRLVEEVRLAVDPHAPGRTSYMGKWPRNL